MKHYSKLKETKLSSKTLYKGILGVKLDTVRLIDGNEGTRLYFDHHGASAVLPIDGDSVYLVQQYRYPVRQVTWEIPAGKRESHQTWLSCAKAELQQEAGLKAGKMKKLTVFYPCCAFSNEELHIFMATDLKKGKMHPDADEFLNVKKFPLKKAFQMVRKGEIKDAKTVISLLMYELMTK